MADWFSELVEQLSEQVVDSKDTKSRMTQTDQVSRDGLKAAAVSSEGELRRRFTGGLTAIEEIRGRIERAEREALGAEWRRVQSARHRVESMRTSAAVRPGRIKRLRQRTHVFGGTSQPGVSLDDALQAVRDAEQAYKAAKAAKNVDQTPSIRSLQDDESKQLSALRAPLRQALMLTVNGVIDLKVKTSYGREFSYAEPAVLTDPLEVSLQPVDTAAYGEVQYLIDKVGSGTIGVAGPRGSGKSTLLSRFAATVQTGGQPQQWGVRVPAPTKYDPRDFLLYLFAQLCMQALGQERAGQVEARLTETGPPGAARAAMRIFLFTAALTLACSGLVVGLRTARLGESSRTLTDLSIASCCALVLAAALLIIAVEVLRRPLSWFPFIMVPPRGRARYIGISFVPLRLLAALSGLAAATLFSLLFVGIAPDPGYLAAAGLGIAGVVGLVVSIRRSPSRGSARAGSDPLVPSYLSDAERWYAKVKFQQSYTTGWSGTITVGTQSFPAQAQGGSSGSTAVTPLAMSTPEIIDALKSFTGSLARYERPAWELGPADDVLEIRIPVIIGIDEIDKIEDPQDAQTFLNQIKGLFGDSNCLFLVSISDDAMAAFERRGVPFRDAFDSSLSAVVVLSYLSREEARALTGSRLVGVQEPVADLLFTLSGGLARDLVRLIRRAVKAREQGKTQLDDLALALITAEIDAKKAAVLARARYVGSCAAQEGLFTWAGTRQSSPDNAEEYFSDVLANAVSLLDSACDGSAHQAANGAIAETAACMAAEIGAFCFWLASVGQVFAKCSSTDDFQLGEAVGGEKSFERLAEARQNFALGPDYVRAKTTAARKAWEVPEPIPEVPISETPKESGSKRATGPDRHSLGPSRGDTTTAPTSRDVEAADTGARARHDGAAAAVTSVVTHGSTKTANNPSPAHGGPPHANPAKLASARVNFAPALGSDHAWVRHGPFDGGWWPQSRNAHAELPALIAALDAQPGVTVQRLNVHHDDWDDIPSQLVGGDGRRVPVDWFTGNFPRDTISVTTAGGREPLTLQVVPPGTSERAARAAMEKAATGPRTPKPGQGQPEAAGAMRRRRAGAPR
jgi:hypothetical protein